jgi:hypothetical protein
MLAAATLVLGTVAGRDGLYAPLRRGGSRMEPPGLSRPLLVWRVMPIRKDGMCRGLRLSSEGGRRV